MFSRLAIPLFRVTHGKEGSPPRVAFRRGIDEGLQTDLLHGSPQPGAGHFCILLLHQLGLLGCQKSRHQESVRGNRRGALDIRAPPKDRFAQPPSAPVPSAGDPEALRKPSGKGSFRQAPPRPEQPENECLSQRNRRPVRNKQDTDFAYRQAHLRHDRDAGQRDPDRNSLQDAGPSVSAANPALCKDHGHQDQPGKAD